VLHPEQDAVTVNSNYHEKLKYPAIFRLMLYLIYISLWLRYPWIHVHQPGHCLSLHLLLTGFWASKSVWSAQKLTSFQSTSV